MKTITITVFLTLMVLAACQPEAKRPPTREEVVKSQFSGWDGSHINLTKWIKNNMNDPASYEHIETRFLDRKDYVLVIAKFRGANTFGGKVVKTVFAQVNSDGYVMETADEDVWEERRVYLEHKKREDEMLKALDSSLVVKKKRKAK